MRAAGQRVLVILSSAPYMIYGTLSVGSSAGPRSTGGGERVMLFGEPALVLPNKALLERLGPRFWMNTRT